MAGPVSRQALGAFDQAAILASLSDDVTIRVAVHDEPLRGKDTASFLFGVLTQELAPFELTEEIVEGTRVSSSSRLHCTVSGRTG